MSKKLMFSKFEKKFSDSTQNEKFWRRPWYTNVVPKLSYLIY
jgi:hypothetical protein